MICQPCRAGTPARKRSSASVFALLFSTGFALVPAGVFATTVAGRTAGSFAVSQTGAATYTIPIWAPPGPQGIQPQIALVYNSQAGGGYSNASATSVTGPSAPQGQQCAKVGRQMMCTLPYLGSQQSASGGSMGVGWSISGLSAIYRCDLTYAQDAAPAPVLLQTSDGYCMDGQRLRLTSTGNYGEAGSTYQTEVANFINVTAYGTAGNGPAYWIAQDRNGRSYTYGNSTTSRVLANGSSTALSWQLNEVSDPSGNTMTIAYTASTGTAVPATISWTPSTHGSSNYNYTMTFAFEANVPQSSYYGYVAGTSVQNTNLLSSITVASSGTTVKKYVLTYGTSPTTGRYELKQVQECSDSAGSNCLLPTVITYQSGTAGVSTSPTTAVSAHTAGTTVYAHYDLNGDGYPDLIYANSGYWYVAFGSASGYGTPVSTGISSSTTILPGDLLGSGKDGFLANNGGTWYYYTWTGSAFTSTSTGLAYDSSVNTQYVLADINGDGLPDLIKGNLTRPNYTVTAYLNTGGGSTVSFGSGVTAYSLNDSALKTATLASAADGATTWGTLRSFDFNGDGREDLILQTYDYQEGVSSYTTYELISQGSTFSAQSIIDEGIAPTGLAFLNWNNDACTDYAQPGASLTTWIITVSGCNGASGGQITINSATVIGAMDWDGDGRTDLIVANGSTIGVYLSTGNGVSNLVTTSVPYSSSDVYFTVQAAGDGMDALGYASTSIGYYKHNGAGAPPDLMSSVTDGYGNSASPTYVSLVQSNYTENGYGTPTYPDRAWIAPMYAVSQATFSDPSSASGGTYYHTYAYFGGTTNLKGRGFESFYELNDYDSRNQLEDRRYFERSFPYTGMQSAENIYSINLGFDPTYSSSTLAPLITLSSTPYQQRYFAYFSNSTTSQREVGSAENGDLITTTSTNYTFDNYGNATSIATTVTDNDPYSPYEGSSNAFTTTTSITPYVDDPNFQSAALSAWCLGLIESVQVQYTGGPPGSAAVTRTKSSTANPTDLAACRHTTLITEPNSSKFKVIETLGYDNFGNVNSDSMAGINMTARTTTISWTNSSVTTGQLPMSVTDPSGAQTQFNYNLNYALRSGVTDPNGELTSWAYTDGFGRLTQESRPDGTYAQYTYQNCSGSTGCLVGSNGLVVGHTVYNKDNSYQSSGTTYFDSVDRSLVANQIMLSGSYSRNEVRYDSLGRVSQKAFPCTWSTLATTCTYWTTNSYDVLNRLVESQRPISASSGGTLCNPLTIPPASGCQGTAYSYAGRTTKVTDSQSNVRTTITDVNGWLRQTMDPMGYNVTLAYDAAGSKTLVTDSLSNQLWSGSYSYGLGAYLTGATDNDMGTWSFTIDALGEMTAWWDAKNQGAQTAPFNMTYDALSRPLTRSEPDFFTQWTWGSSAASHNIYKLASVCTGTGSSPTNCTTNPGYSENDSYDNVARLSQQSIILPGPNGGTFAYAWAYSSNTGLLNTLTYPVSYPSNYALQLQYGYTNGVLQSITDTTDLTSTCGTTCVVWTANTMDPMGHVTEETLGNGVVTNRSFDSVTGWLGTAQSGVNGGSGVKNLGFLYDEMGNVTQRQDNNLGLTENIYYDNDYRFSYSKLNSMQNLSVTYDAKGNIASRSDVASGAVWTYGTTQIHAVTQAGSSSYQYAYDANGNAYSRQGASITWSSYNYPTTVNAGSGSTAESVSFNYGPARQRWQQSYSGNSTTEVTDYAGPLFEVVSSGGATNYRHYITAAGENVAVYSRQNTGTYTFNYLVSDHQASVASITNTSGAQVVGESFDAFGNRRNPTTWSGPDTTLDLTTIAGISRQGYTFQTALGLWMGMNHMNGRVEDSVTGRFLSADPFVPDQSDPQSYNRLSYVRNNPLSWLDPSGFKEICDDATDPDCAGAGNAPSLPPPGPPPGNSGLWAYICVGDPINYACNWESVSQGNLFGVGNYNAGNPPPPGPFGHSGPSGEQPQPLETVTVTGHLPPKPQWGHFYTTYNLVCHRPLDAPEQRDFISRFTVPNAYTQGQPKPAGTYLVADSLGIPGGWVTTTYSPDGLAGTNQNDAVSHL